MKIEKAERNHFEDICKLITSPEEMYLVYPSGRYPLDLVQLEHLKSVRDDLSIISLDNKVIGFANIYDIKEGQSAFIGNVIIDKAQRGKGYGLALIKHMMELIKTKHKALPHLSVFGNNVKAIMLYKGLGFVPYDVEERNDNTGQKVALFHMRHEN